ncbi:MAG: xanthine phosphoribosyltransferase [Sphaerochaetaceae bacterium]|nr:xanthine phosphoribosyltransferase [Sphaerochaetaceae bacterium]
MDELKARILSEGKVLPGNIIKVGSFLNHKIDTDLMSRMADEFGKHFDLSKVSLILTIEASGIALASICSLKWGIPMVFAKKAKSDNIENGILHSEIYSYTYKKTVNVMVEAEHIKPTDNVLVMDDFLANGEAVRGLTDVVKGAGASLAGVAIAVEKGFQGGGDRLRAAGIDVYSLAIIDDASDGTIKFREN